MTEHFSLEKIPAFTKDVLTRANKDGTYGFLKMDVDDCFYRADGLAAKASQMIDGTKSLQFILEKLLQETEADASQVQSDLENFVASLLDEGLIEFEYKKA